MSIDEQARRELHERLEEALGAGPAGTLMASLPPQGWAGLATKADLERVEERFDARFDTLEERFGARFEALEERFDLKLGSATNELRADFRGEITAAITAQTRTVILALFGTFLSSGGLVLAAARLG